MKCVCTTCKKHYFWLRGDGSTLFACAKCQDAYWEERRRADFEEASYNDDVPTDTDDDDEETS